MNTDILSTRPARTTCLSRLLCQPAVLLGGIVVLATLLQFPTLREGHNWGGDFSQYIHHAKNLVEGRPYADTGFIWNPHHKSPAAYPPVFPLLLAPVYAFFGLDFTAFKVLVIAFFTLFLVAAALTLHRGLTLPARALLVALLGASPYLCEFKNSVLSDLPFAFFLLLFLALLERAWERGPAPPRPWGTAVAAGALLYLVCGTRTVGLALIPAVLAVTAVAPGRRWFAAAICLVTFTALRLLQGLVLPLDLGYLGLLSTLGWRSIWSNAIEYTQAFLVIWWNGYSPAYNIALFSITTGLALAGLATRLRRGLALPEAFAACYLALIVVWPHNEGTRFLIPLLPLYFYWMLLGCGVVSRRLPRVSAQFVTMVVAAAAFASYLGAFSRMEFGPLSEGIEKPASVEFFNFIRRETTPEDVIIFSKPRVLCLLTDRRASVYHQPETDDELFAYLHGIDATRLVIGPMYYVQVPVQTPQGAQAGVRVVGPEEPAYLLRIVNQYSKRFTLLWRNADFLVYRIEWDGESIGAAKNE